MTMDHGTCNIDVGCSINIQRTDGECESISICSTPPPPPPPPQLQFSSMPRACLSVHPCVRACVAVLHPRPPPSPRRSSSLNLENFRPRPRPRPRLCPLGVCLSTAAIVESSPSSVPPPLRSFSRERPFVRVSDRRYLSFFSPARSLSLGFSFCPLARSSALALPPVFLSILNFYCFLRSPSIVRLGFSPSLTWTRSCVSVFFRRRCHAANRRDSRGR